MVCSLPDSSVHGILQSRVPSGLPFPTPGALPYPGIEPGCPALQSDSLSTEPPGKPAWLTEDNCFCLGLLHFW